MENAVAVANFFVKKSLETGINLTPMKVVKLVYIAHGWYLALYNEPLIGEGVQAWKYGPVIPSVYNKFRHYGSGSITQPASYGIDSGQFVYYGLANESIVPFLNKIWEVYKGYDGIQLSAMTHQADTPWDEAWNKLGGENKMEFIIPNNLIQSHYKQLVDTNVARSALRVTA